MSFEIFRAFQCALLCRMRLFRIFQVFCYFGICGIFVVFGFYMLSLIFLSGILRFYFLVFPGFHTSCKGSSLCCPRKALVVFAHHRSSCSGTQEAVAVIAPTLKTKRDICFLYGESMNTITLLRNKMYYLSNHSAKRILQNLFVPHSIRLFYNES